MEDKLLNYIWILPLIYSLLFILFASFKFYLRKYINKDNPFLCSVCAAFFTAMIFGFLVNYHQFILTFMLGMTTTGLAKASDDYLFIKRKKDLPAQYFLLQLFYTMISLLIIIYYIK